MLIKVDRSRETTKNKNRCTSKAYPVSREKCQRERAFSRRHVSFFNVSTSLRGRLAGEERPISWSDRVSLVACRHRSARSLLAARPTAEAVSVTVTTATVDLLDDIVSNRSKK